jgi:sugar transferase (PEP-CTERM/EpsH1 system associated)
MRRAHALNSFIFGRTITEGAFHSSALQRTIDAWAAETPFTAALASSSGVAQFLHARGLSAVPCVVDLVDVDSQKWFDYSDTSAFGRKWLYRTEGRRLRVLESKLARWAKAVTLVSDAEAELFRKSVAADNVHSVRNGVDFNYFRAQRNDNENGCVFTGALDYVPNVDAVSWFCSEVWPEVRRRHPACRMRIVGRRPVRAVRALERITGVEVVGQVPDVRPHLTQAAVAVAPLRIARGLQNKVLEALAMGKPVVASPQALNGINRDDVPALVARSVDEWASQIDRLLRDDAARRELGCAGRRYAEDHHDWDQCLQPIEALLGLAPDATPECPPAAIVTERA